MAPNNKFSEGERVLCYHGPLIYEAKVLKFRVSEDDSSLNEYWVHYAGWNKNWDEWVPESRILKYNESNVSKQKELQKSHKSSVQKKTKTTTPKLQKTSNKESKTTESKSDGSVQDSDSRSSTPNLDSKTKFKKDIKKENAKGAGDTPSSSSLEMNSEASKRKKRIKQELSETDLKSAEQSIKVKIPNELKQWLVNDWSLISRQKKLVRLPADRSIDEILDDYMLYKSKNKGNMSLAVCREVCRGLKDYFNSMIGCMLIFQFERLQHSELVKGSHGRNLSEIYGSHHFLRLLSKFGSILVQAELDEKSVTLVVSIVEDIAKYLEQENLFSEENYEAATSEYFRKST